MPADVRADGVGGYVIQAVGVAGGEEYLVRVAGRPGEAGNYSLVLDFNQPRDMLQTLAAGTVGAAGQRSHVHPLAPVQRRAVNVQVEDPDALHVGV